MNYYSIESETQQNIWSGVSILLIHPICIIVFRQSYFTDSEVVKVKSEVNLNFNYKHKLN